MQWMSTTRKTLLAVSTALLLGACASNDGLKERTSTEKAHDLSETQTDLAIALMDDNNSREALAIVQKAISSNSKNVRAWTMQAQIEQELKMNDKAAATFRQALSLAPNSAEVNNSYGWFVCDGLKQPKESIQYFDKALADPTYPSPYHAYYNKGVCFNKMGNPHQGKEYLMRALQAQPKFFPAKREIARIDLELGQVRSAEQYFGDYQSRVEQLSASDILLGWKIARAAGQTQAAYEYEMLLQVSYPYSDELREITTGK